MECQTGTCIFSFKPLAFGRMRATGIDSRIGLRGVSWTTAEFEYILYERV